MKISVGELKTPVGILALAAGPDGLAGIEFDRGTPDKTRDVLRKSLLKRFGNELELTNDTGPLAGIFSWLESYFGNPAAAERYNGPLDSGGTDFQRGVWKQLANIKPGKVATYGEIATKIGNPGAVRAVGSACGANPLPIVVPCHRVVASGGPGGFGGGLELKRKLLAGEGYLLS